MNPSTPAITAIRARVTDWTPDNPTIAASLNTPSVANPVPVAPTVLKPFATADLMGKVVLPAGDPNAGQPDAVALSKIYDRPAVVAFRDDCVKQDRSAVGAWLQLAFLSGDISQAQYAAMVGVIQATQPDPSWAAQISWAVATLGRPVDASDIAASRPGA
jgi:hypothetical protein